jgi:hypothetical protein
MVAAKKPHSGFFVGFSKTRRQECLPTAACLPQVGQVCATPSTEMVGRTFLSATLRRGLFPSPPLV